MKGRGKQEGRNCNVVKQTLSKFKSELLINFNIISKEINNRESLRLIASLFHPSIQVIHNIDFDA